MNRMDRDAWVDAIAQANANGWHNAELGRRINKSPQAVSKACKRYGLNLRWEGQKGRTADQQQPQEAGVALADKLCRLERAVHRARLEVAALRERVSELEARNV